jgi:predicted glycosyltransferase
MALRDVSGPQGATAPRAGARVMMYSHDTFGLGHIRRSRAIANALVKSHDEISILIVSGSSLAGSFNFGGGIDFVRVPGIIKNEDGSYASADLRLDIEEVTALREGLIRQTAEIFRPDIFIADKEPAGFRGEILPTLVRLGAMGTHRILGIRDVLDERAVLRAEWHRKGAMRTLVEHYDDVLIYGVSAFHEPLRDIGLPPEIERRLVYTGYLERSVPAGPPAIRYPRSTKEPFLLVTAGGGGDGHGMIDWVNSAYENDPGLPLPAVIVFGPYMSRSQRRAFLDRIDRLDNIETIAFDPKIERLMSRATAIVAMGGYNTFCEILSFDKPALLVPRSRPRQEQTIRARRAAELGLVSVLEDPMDSGAAWRDPLAMAAALRRLANQPPPSSASLPGLLHGLGGVCAHVEPLLADRARLEPLRAGL